MIAGEATIDDLRERIAELEQERDELAANVYRLDNELQAKALTGDGALADAYWHCVDIINPYLGEETGPDTLINSVCGSLEFLIQQWREKKILEQERNALARFANNMVTELFEHPGSDIDGKLAEDCLLEAGIIFGTPYEPSGKHSQTPVEDLEEGEELLQCCQWFLKAVAATKLENTDV